MIDRERKVDLDKMSDQELKDLEDRLGTKVREICDEACEKANKLLNIYGLSTKMQIVVGPKEVPKKSITDWPTNPVSKPEPIKPVEAKKKRGRPKRVPQSLY